MIDDARPTALITIFLFFCVRCLPFHFCFHFTQKKMMYGLGFLTIKMNFK